MSTRQTRNFALCASSLTTGNLGPDGIHPTAAGSKIYAQTIADAIPLGEKISVYATSSGGASAHEVHRNHGNDDGTIVLGPDTAHPKMMLFSFADQTF